MEWTVAIGVDTHKEVHVAVALDVLGVQLDSREITTTLNTAYHGAAAPPSVGGNAPQR